MKKTPAEDFYNSFPPGVRDGIKAADDKLDASLREIQRVFREANDTAFALHQQEVNVAYGLTPDGKKLEITD